MTGCGKVRSSAPAPTIRRSAGAFTASYLASIQLFAASQAWNRMAW